MLVNNVLFQVIGVMAPRGASPTGQDQDDVVLVPYATGQLRLSGQRFLRNVTVAVDDVARIDETQAAVEALLAQRHGTVDFQIRNMASIIETATETQNTLTILLGSIAAISLLVGGIGVMNIMLVSVTERTREIGIRMATGARTRNILQQFLTEALVVSALGGAIGVVLRPRHRRRRRCARHAGAVLARAGAARLRLRIRDRTRLRLPAGAQGREARPGRRARLGMSMTMKTLVSP